MIQLSQELRPTQILLPGAGTAKPTIFMAEAKYVRMKPHGTFCLFAIKY